MTKFSERLKSLRKEYELTQLELANRIGTSKSSVNMYERGEREPGLETLEAFADCFNVDLDYLMGKSDFKNKSTWLENMKRPQKKEVLSIKDQHPELLFYDDSQEPQIPRLEPVGKPKDQILTGNPATKYFTPEPSSIPFSSLTSSDDEMRNQNEEEMLQLFRKLSTRDQIKEITRLELLQEK